MNDLEITRFFRGFLCHNIHAAVIVFGVCDNIRCIHMIMTERFSENNKISSDKRFGVIFRTTFHLDLTTKITIRLMDL